MLILENGWIKEEKGQIKKVEYRKMDFYGPFLTIDLKKSESGNIRAYPCCIKIETVQVSENHFNLLCDAAKELYNEIGPYILVTKLFDVKIDSEKTEELILKKFKSMQFF